SNELQIKKAIKDDIDKIPSLVNKTSHLDNGGTINADYVLYDGGNVKDELDGVIDVVGTDRKNLIPYPYASTEDYGKDFTRYGIHYITDDNGIIKASGTVTSSAGIFLELISRDEDRALLLPKGKYRLSGMKINSSTSQTSPSLQVRNIVTPSITYASDRGGGAEFTLEENTKIRLGIAGSNGITFDVVVAPMIVKVSEDGTYPTEYIPYMPNGIVGKVNELTAKLSMLEDNNAGVNLIDINKLEQGIFDTQGVDYPSTEASYNKTVRFKGIYTVKPNTTYTINAQSNKNVQVYVLYFSATVGTWGTGWKTFPFTFTPDASTSEIRIGFRVPDGDTLSPSDFSNIQIQLGNEATKYEQYNGLSNAQLSEATENITKELKENKKLNGLFVEYNANTDRTVEANRIAAIKYLIENYGSCIAAVRYSGGYYHQVIITKFNRDFFITEHTHTTKQIVYWQSNGTTTTKLYTITGV
ncbi:MAG: hypothetical protein KBT27_14805, partial [Prevotellaceae bacterium]|nr:hypothetical protein [Candidatus Faecinaster equi]